MANLALKCSIVRRCVGGLQIDTSSENNIIVTNTPPIAAWPDLVDPSEGAHDSVALRPARILVVDDDDQVRNLASTILRLAGYEVMDAGSGPEAIQMVEQAETPLQLILADVVMPKLSGHQLASHLIALQPDVKILLMSGYPNFSGFLNRAVSRSEAIKVETSFIQKPFNSIDLISKVREVLGHAI